MKDSIKVCWIIIFSIAMAALESAVVVYLRELYYPDGFTVAFKLISERILLIEIIREAATLIMLLSIAYLCGKNFKARFALFLLSFAAWDIFYYVWLKLFIDWPMNLLEWDILFLIPFTWLAPVLAPIICSINMIVLAAVLMKSNDEKPFTKLSWSLLISGCILILFTFMKDYGGLLLSNGFIADYAHLMNNQKFIEIASSYIPKYYSWFIFLIGEGLIVIATVELHMRGRMSIKDLKQTISNSK